MAAIAKTGMSKPVAKSRVPLGLAALLAALSTLSPFSIDTFFPALRAMQGEFGLGPLEIQQTLTAYMLLYAFMSLVHGPLSDAIGRRPVVLWGLALYAVASLACVFAPSFWALLVFRAMQGVTAGAGLAVGRAVIRDLYDGPDAQRLMNTVTMFFSLAPAIAPVAGGFVYAAFGWRYVFAMLAVLGFTVWFATFHLLRETHPSERRIPLGLGSLAATSWSIARNPRFLLLATASAANFSALLAYIGAAPAIVLDTWGLRETQFAALFVPIIGGFLIGAIISSRMAGRLPQRRQLVVGFGCMLAGALGTALLAAMAAHPPLLAQQLLLTLTTLGVQFISPLLQLRLLDMFPQTRGSVVSVSSFVSLIFGSVVIGFVAPVFAGSLVALGLWAAAAAVVSLALLLLISRRAAALQPA